MTVTRWSKRISPGHAIKRGLASLFVCAVVALPLATFGVQLKDAVVSDDPRKAEPLAAMQVRAADQTSDPLKPFQEPLITVTFDDGWESIYSVAMPILQKYGIPTTQYVLSGTDHMYNYMSFAQMQRLARGGHEIACHSIDHQDLTVLNLKDVQRELTECKDVVNKKAGVNIREFASPYGRSNPDTIQAIKQHYRSHRNTDGDITTNVADDQDINTRANFNRYNILCVTLRRDTTVAQLQAAIDYTVKNNGWLVLNYHQVDDSDSDFGLDIDLLKSQIATVSQSSSRIATIGEVMDAIQAAEAAPPAAGANQEQR